MEKIKILILVVLLSASSLSELIVLNGDNDQGGNDQGDNDQGGNGQGGNGQGGNGQGGNGQGGNEQCEQCQQCPAPVDVCGIYCAGLTGLNAGYQPCTEGSVLECIPIFNDGITTPQEECDTGDANDPRCILGVTQEGYACEADVVGGTSICRLLVAYTDDLANPGKAYLIMFRNSDWAVRDENGNIRNDLVNCDDIFSGIDFPVNFNETSILKYFTTDPIDFVDQAEIDNFISLSFSYQEGNFVFDNSTFLKNKFSIESDGITYSCGATSGQDPLLGISSFYCLVHFDIFKVYSDVGCVPYLPTVEIVGKTSQFQFSTIQHAPDFFNFFQTQSNDIIRVGDPINQTKYPPA